MNFLTRIAQRTSAACRQAAGLQTLRHCSTAQFHWQNSRYNGITVDLGKSEPFSAQDFARQLKAMLSEWQSDGKRGVWLRVPAYQSHLIETCMKIGFTYHHALGDTAVLTTWLAEGFENKLPRFATHQLGVAGCVIDEETGQTVVVKDKKQPGWPQMWKFPGGLADFGEYIGEAAVREVWEETGILSEFSSLLMFRQAHHIPYAFDQSDFYAICRLTPSTFEIDKCVDEIAECQWMDIEEVATTKDATPICNLGAKIALHGLEHGFDKVDICSETMNSWVYRGRTFQVFHRPFGEES